jgi:hypothetical protein
METSTNFPGNRLAVCRFSHSRRHSLRDRFVGTRAAPCLRIFVDNPFFVDDNDRQQPDLRKLYLSKEQVGGAFEVC